LPEEAWIGATPQRWAQAALGVIAGGHEQGRGGVDPHAEEPQHLRRTRGHQMAEQLVDARELLFEGEHSTSKRSEQHLGGIDDRIC